MNLSSIETNLLIVLDALLKEKNVTRAAKRVGRGQPAMSHALTRLREYFADPLLVAKGREFVLSPKAQELREPVARAIAALAEVFDGRTAEDPRIHRTFAVASTDLFAWRFVPDLLLALQRDVPDLILEARPLVARSTDAILSDGVDLAFGVFEDVPPYINQQELFADPYVCVVRTGHPAARKRLSLAQYLDLPHLEVIPAPGARTGNRVDRILAAAGKRRRVTMKVFHFAIAQRVLETNDHVLTMTKGNAEAFVQDRDLRIVNAPFDFPAVRFSQIWRRQNDDDAAHRWLRETAARICIPAQKRGR